MHAMILYQGMEVCCPVLRLITKRYRPTGAIFHEYLVRLPGGELGYAYANQEDTYGIAT